MITGGYNMTTERESPWIHPWYDEIEPIKVLDPTAWKAGSSDDRDQVFPIYLTDVMKWNGHLCLGLARGYRAATIAFDELCDSPPQRGDFKVKFDRDTCMVDAFAYIAGIRSDFGRQNLGTIEIDKTGAVTGRDVYVVHRLSTGGTVEVVMNFGDLEDFDELWALKAMMTGVRLPHGADFERYRELMQKLSYDVLTIPAKEFIGVRHL